MSDLFDAFESGPSNTDFFDSAADPAAEFLAREQAEFAKIENNDFLNDDSNTVNQFSGMKLETLDNFGSDFGQSGFTNDFGESSTDPCEKPMEEEKNVNLKLNLQQKKS